MCIQYCSNHLILAPDCYFCCDSFQPPKSLSMSKTDLKIKTVLNHLLSMSEQDSPFPSEVTQILQADKSLKKVTKCGLNLAYPAILCLTATVFSTAILFALNTPATTCAVACCTGTGTLGAGCVGVQTTGTIPVRSNEVSENAQRVIERMKYCFQQRLPKYFIDHPQDEKVKAFINDSHIQKLKTSLVYLDIGWGNEEANDFLMNLKDAIKYIKTQSNEKTRDMGLYNYIENRRSKEDIDD